MITVDAATLAKGWLSVAVAASTEADEQKHRPQLYRTVQIQQYPHGLRLAATDGILLLHTWVPERHYDLDDTPGLDEVPYASAVAIDAFGRGAGLLAHLLRLTRREDSAKNLDVTVALNVKFEDDGPERIDGLDALAVTIAYEDNERLQLQVYEGEYPNWQRLLKRSGRSGTVALSQAVTARLARAAKPHGEAATIKCWLSGTNKPLVVAFGADPEITGLVMPVRWDLDRDMPYEQPTKDKAE